MSTSCILKDYFSATLGESRENLLSTVACPLPFAFHRRHRHNPNQGFQSDRHFKRGFVEGRFRVQHHLVRPDSFLIMYQEYKGDSIKGALPPLFDSESKPCHELVVSFGGGRRASSKWSRPWSASSTNAGVRPNTASSPATSGFSSPSEERDAPLGVLCGCVKGSDIVNAATFGSPPTPGGRRELRPL
jgi:hypothetical protein